MVEVKKTVKNRAKGNKTAKPVIKKDIIAGETIPSASTETIKEEPKKDVIVESAATVDDKTEEKKVETKVEAKDENNPKHETKVLRYFTEFWNGISMND